MNKEQVVEIAHKVSTAIKTLELQNDYYNLLPNPESIDSDEIITRYILQYRVLKNIFELNQTLIDDLDDAVAFIFDIAEEMQDTPTSD